MSEDALAEAVRSYVAEARAEPLERITLSTRLREDTGLMGDDVDEFFSDFSARFGVDLDGFEFYRHFQEEPHLAWPITQLWQAWKRGRWSTDPVTVKDLLRVARARTWEAFDHM